MLTGDGPAHRGAPETTGADAGRTSRKSDMTPQAISYAESGKRAMRPDSLLKISAALCVSADYLLTGDIVDKDLLILSDKMRQLTTSQIRCIETIIDECIHLFRKMGSNSGIIR